MTHRRFVYLWCFVFLPFLGACAPKVYVIDRQTILEDEAAGEWPDFEREILKKSKAHGPTPFSKVPMSKKRESLYNVLNGSLVTNSEDTR